MGGGSPPRHKKMPKKSGYKPRKHSYNTSFKRAAAGSRINSALTTYKRMKSMQKKIKAQAKGLNPMVKMQRTVYSNWEFSTGDPREVIYVTNEANGGFRVWDSGSSTYKNADTYTIFFTPNKLVITWWELGVVQTVTQYTFPDFAEFVSLFEQCQIDYVEIEWFYNASNVQRNDNPIDGGNGGPVKPVYAQPQHLYVKDYNDAQYVKLGEIVQYENQRSWQMGTNFSDRRHVVRVKPRLTQVATNSDGLPLGIVQNYTKNQWLETSQCTDIQHYGLKGRLNNFGSNGGDSGPFQEEVIGSIGFRATMHYVFKQVK